MRIQLTKQECIWLAELVKKAKEQAGNANKDNPHRILELRRDNMADLENRLNSAIKKELQREGTGAR